jgi:CubicO group peptidase (beta-lactamase class C family)
VGIAIEKKLLSGVEEEICSYYGDVWDCSDASDSRTRIHVKHTMNVETGIEWHEDWRSTASIAQNDAFNAGLNMLDFVLKRPGVDEPGSRKRYSTADASLLSGVLQGATGKTALAFGREVLFGKIGIPDIQWSQDSSGRTMTYASMQGTLREFGKFGFLYSRHGVWDGEQVVPGDWIDFTTRAVDACKEQYRYLWHINLPQRFGTFDENCADFPSCVPTAFGDYPSDAFFAEGIRGQFIFIVPSRDLVVVRNASDAMGSEFWDEYGQAFLTKVLDSILGGS